MPERSGHDDLVMALMLAMGVGDVASRPNGGRIYVAEGEVPQVRLALNRTKHGAPPAVVRDGEQRPTDRLLRFSAARRHPGYQPPSTWCGR